jgi:hypothetical protein
MISTNLWSAVFYWAVLVLFMVLSSHQISSNFLVSCSCALQSCMCSYAYEAWWEFHNFCRIARNCRFLQLWLVLGVFLMATSLRMYATCQQLQAQAQAHAAAANGFLGRTELRVHVPPSIALATRGRLQSLRLQLALLDREFDDLGT